MERESDPFEDDESNLWTLSGRDPFNKDFIENANKEISPRVSSLVKCFLNCVCENDQRACSELNDQQVHSVRFELFQKQERSSRFT